MSNFSYILKFPYLRENKRFIRVREQKVTNSYILVRLRHFYKFIWCFRKPRTIDPDAMAVDAMQKMESPPSPVQFLPVIDQDNVLIGIVTLHGLVSAGL